MVWSLVLILLTMVVAAGTQDPACYNELHPKPGLPSL